MFCPRIESRGGEGHRGRPAASRRNGSFAPAIATKGETVKAACLLSSPQDRRQNEESGFYALSSPSPCDEGVGRGTGRGEVPVNSAQTRPQPVQGTPLPSPLPA